MIMLDKWEEMASDIRYDRHTVEACRELAFAMCNEIFVRMGLDVQFTEDALRVAGRGCTYLFPTRGRAIKARALDLPRIMLPPPIRRGRKGLKLGARGGSR